MALHNLRVDLADHLFHARLRRLTDLAEPEIATLTRTCSIPRLVRAKADLVHHGDKAERVHVLLDGWACRFKLLPDGRRQITAVLLPGDICNLDSLYMGRNHYGVLTLTACTTTTIDREELRGLALAVPAIGDALGRLVALDNVMLTERSASLGRRSAREHLAHFLCELMVRLMPVGLVRDDGYRLSITQEEMGDALGLTAVHVNRVMQSLRHDGAIESANQSIVIRDWERLRRIAGFDPGYLHLEAPVSGAAIPPVRSLWPS